MINRTSPRTKRFFFQGSFHPWSIIYIRNYLLIRNFLPRTKYCNKKWIKKKVSKHQLRVVFVTTTQGKSSRIRLTIYRSRDARTRHVSEKGKTEKAKIMSTVSPWVEKRRSNPIIELISFISAYRLGVLLYTWIIQLSSLREHYIESQEKKIECRVRVLYNFFFFLFFGKNDRVCAVFLSPRL